MKKILAELANSYRNSLLDIMTRRLFFWGLLPAAGGYSLWSSNCALKGLLSFRSSLLFWGLHLASLVGATLWGSQVCSALRRLRLLGLA